jgi:hypothetical protein
MSSTRGDEELNSRVRLLLVMHFNESELRDLCFDLGVDYESLPGHAKSDKARELLGYARRHARWEELMLHCARLRPRVEWTPTPARAGFAQRPGADASPPFADLAASLDQLGRLLNTPQAPAPTTTPMADSGEELTTSPPQMPQPGDRIDVKVPSLNLSKAEHILGLSMAAGSATTGASLGKHISELLKQARSTSSDRHSPSDQHETSLDHQPHNAGHELAPDIEHDNADDDGNDVDD